MIKSMGRSAQLCTIMLIAILTACSASEPTYDLTQTSTGSGITLPPANTPKPTRQATSTPDIVLPTQVPETAIPMTEPTVVQPDVVPTETSTPVPQKMCEDRAAFVGDVSLPDGTLIQPGKQIQKTWRLRNTGTCTWTDAYSLAFHSGDSMGTYASAPMENSVLTGQEINLSIDLTAPLLHGRYKSYWMLRDSDGSHFGFGPGAKRPFWVDVVVGPSVNPRCNVDQLPSEPHASMIGMGEYTVAVSGSYAFATTPKGLSVFDVSDAPKPTLVATVRRSWGKVVDLVVRDKYMYVGDGIFSVFDITDPEAPFLAGEVFVGGQPQNMDVAGNYAYVLDFDSGLHVIDITDPAKPTEIGHSSPIEWGRGLAVQANYAFIGSRESREGRGYGFLKVFDLTNPTSPREAGFLGGLGSGVEDVVVSGDRAFVSVRVDGYDWDFWVVDVSTPSAPVPLGRFEGTQIIWDMAISGECAFIINFEVEGFMALDVSNPFALREIGVLNLFGSPNRLVVKGGVVYIADSDEGLLLLPVLRRIE